MQPASKWRQTKATECRAVQSGSPQTSATKVHTRMKYVVPGWNICFVIKYMVLTPPGKFLKVLVFPLFFKGLDISGNQCRFWKVLEIWRQGPGQFLNLLCFKIQIWVTLSSSSSSKVQSSMVEYHALVTYGHVTWLSGRSNHWCLLWVCMCSVKELRNDVYLHFFINEMVYSGVIGFPYSVILH